MQGSVYLSSDCKISVGVPVRIYPTFLNVLQLRHCILMYKIFFINLYVFKICLHKDMIPQCPEGWQNMWTSIFLALLFLGVCVHLAE